METAQLGRPVSEQRQTAQGLAAVIYLRVSSKEQA